MLKKRCDCAISFVNIILGGKKMYFMLKHQKAEMRKIFPRKMPKNKNKKINLATAIVRNFVRPAGTSNFGIFYIAAGVIICESKNMDDFIEKYDKFCHLL